MKQSLLILILPIMALTFSSYQDKDTKNNKENTQTQEKSVVHEPLKLDKFETIKLIKPDNTGGKTLMETLHLRKSDREFDKKNLSLKHLSDILWVANGINREDIGKRTVPSAMAKYPIKTYAVMENGIYYYDPAKHQLEPVVEGDHRKLSGLQDFVYDAPLNIVFIADYNVYEGERPVPQDRRLYLAALDAAHCCQNIYLYCASEGLRTVERAGAKSDELIKILNLDENHQFVVAQTVGY
jgi:SagB-type dehydrogenase family enzyme